MVDFEPSAIDPSIVDGLGSEKQWESITRLFRPTNTQPQLQPLLPPHSSTNLTPTPPQTSPHPTTHDTATTLTSTKLFSVLHHDSNTLPPEIQHQLVENIGKALYTSFTDHDFALSVAEQNIMDHGLSPDKSTQFLDHFSSSTIPELEQAIQDGNFYVDPNSFDARQINVAGTIGVTQPAFASSKFAGKLPPRKPLVPVAKTLKNPDGEDVNAHPINLKARMAQASAANAPIADVDESDQELNAVVQEAGTMDNQF